MSEMGADDAAKIERRNLLARRFRETQIYLQSVKAGHPNICALEGYAEFEEDAWDEDENPGLTNVVQYFELCDAGSLAMLEEQFKAKGALLPEAFLWHVFEQLMDALAFMHKEHPDYANDPEVLKRPVMVHHDLKPANIFLKWNEGDKSKYPDVKVGDLGNVKYLPLGGELVGNESNGMGADPPEWPLYSAKDDVWSAGTVMYKLATGKVQKKTDYSKTTNNIPDLPLHISRALSDMIKRALVSDYKQRPGSGELYMAIKVFRAQAGNMLFRELPDWCV